MLHALLERWHNTNDARAANEVPDVPKLLPSGVHRRHNICLSSHVHGKSSDWDMREILSKAGKRGCRWR